MKKYITTKDTPEYVLEFRYYGNCIKTHGVGFIRQGFCDDKNSSSNVSRENEKFGDLPGRELIGICLRKF